MSLTLEISISALGSSTKDPTSPNHVPGRTIPQGVRTTLETRMAGFSLPGVSTEYIEGQAEWIATVPINRLTPSAVKAGLRQLVAGFAGQFRGSLRVVEDDGYVRFSASATSAGLNFREHPVRPAPVDDPTEPFPT